MKCKALQLKVEFELHAITCPGVWLCPSGMVSAQIFMLNTCTRTSLLDPIFPMLCHEKFQFKKTFYGVKSLKDIDNYLWKEDLYIELVQWRNLEVGCVLAFFQTTLAELLYPPTSNKCVSLGLDVDLLMEATDRFPGIIAPKLEVSTKTTIEEILCKCSLTSSKPNPNKEVVKPVYKTSKRVAPIRQKKVCHTYDYHMVKMGTEPNYYSDDEDLFRGRNELVSKPTRRPKTCDPKKKTRSKIIVKCCCEQPEEYNYNSYTNHSGSSTKKIEKHKESESFLYDQSSVRIPRRKFRMVDKFSNDDSSSQNLSREKQSFCPSLSSNLSRLSGFCDESCEDRESVSRYRTKVQTQVKSSPRKYKHICPPSKQNCCCCYCQKKRRNQCKICASYEEVFSNGDDKSKSDKAMSTTSIYRNRKDCNNRYTSAKQESKKLNKHVIPSNNRQKIDRARSLSPNCISARHLKELKKYCIKCKQSCGGSCDKKIGVNNPQYGRCRKARQCPVISPCTIRKC